MIIEIPDENSIVKWKNDDKDEWKVAEISDLIKAYERPQDNLIQSLTELCDRYCKFCPVTGGPNGTDCTDCICTHIRRIMRGKEE